jgi:AcrR family transcriptional regulator
MSVLTDGARRGGRGGRRRTYLRADDRRRQILDVAKGVFARRGYHRANVAHICQAARIGRGTLYQYFDNKEAVMEALLADIAERIAQVLDARPTIPTLPEGSYPPRELVAAFCRRRLRKLLDAVFSDEDMLRLVAREARALGGPFDRALERIDEIVLRALQGDIELAQKMRLLRPGASYLYARFILGGIEKIILTALSRDEKIDLDEVTRISVDLELHGLLSEGFR